MQVVVFKLGQEEYAFNIKDVQEIVRLQDATTIPNAPFYIEGVINLRNKIVPVINLAKKFNLTMDEDNDTCRLIVLNIAEGKQIAIKAAEVTEVLNIEESNVEREISVLENEKNHCVIGIAKMDDKLIILLDTQKLIDAKELPRISLDDLN